MERQSAVARLRSSRPGGLPAWALAAAIALPLVLFSVDLGTLSLWDPDEGLAAEIAREMLITRQWLAPQLNFQPYAEKPPVYFWILAGTMSAFGTRNEAAIRLPSVLLAVAAVWLLLAWGWRHLRPMAAILAALVLSTSGGYVAIGRLGIDDALSGVLLAIALLGMSEPLFSRQAKFPWLFYLPLGAAVLISGPMALLLPPLVAISFVTALREPGRLLGLRPFRGLGLLFALVAPVLGVAAARYPGYVRSLFFEHSSIFLLDAAFADRHSYSLGAFAAITPLLMLPWGVFLPWSLRDSLRGGGERSADARWFLACWLLGDLLYFSISAGNLAHYAVVAMFPLSLLTGRSLARFLRRPRPQSLFSDPILPVAGVVFLAVLVGPFVTRRLLQDQFPIYADKIVFTFLLIPIAAAGVGAVVRRYRSGAVAAVATCGAVTLIGVYHFGSETISAYNSMEVPAALIADRLPPDASLVSYGTTSHTLAFYSGRPVRPLTNLRQAEPLLNGDAPVAILTKERYLPELRTELKRALYIWWEGDSKKMLLSNIPPPLDGDRRILLPAS